MATVTVTGRTDTKERRRSKKDMEKRQNEEMEIDLLELFGVLIRKWKFLLLGLIIGGVLAGGYTWLQTPVYQSTAKLYVLSSTTSITSVADLQLGTELSTDFVEIAQSRPVIDAAIETLEADEGITLTRDEVHTMTTVSVKTDTRILSIAVQNEDPELACSLANALSEATADQMAAITKSDPPTTFERAEVEKEPMDNNLTRNTAVGALAGLIIMALIFVIPYLTNDKICTTEDVEKYLETGVLGTIPDMKGGYHSKNAKRKA